MRPCVPIGSDSCFTQEMKPHFGGAFCLDGLIVCASCLFIVDLMTTVNEPGLLLEQMQENGQNVLR